MMVEKLNYAAFRLCSFTSLVIPNSVTTIGNSAFAFNYDVTTVTFEANSSLVSIGSHAFGSSRFTSITLPDSLEFIGNYAFSNNTFITYIYSF